MREKKLMKNKNNRPKNGDVFTVDGSALEEYAKHRPKAVLELWYKATAQKRAAALAAQSGWVLSPAPDKTEGMGESSLWATVRVPTRGEPELWPRIAGRKEDLIVALDHINDPRNLGAIVRTAAFFGVKEIIAPKDRQVGITGAAVATSQGGFSLCDFFCVTNLVRSLEKLKKEGYWIIGTNMNSPAIGQITQRYEKVVLVLGSEGRGISSLLEKSCDLFVSIPGAKDGLQSLNVSVAAGILIQSLFLR